MAKGSWDKEKAVLHQKLEFVKYQLDDEKKKFEETKQNHESMLNTISATNRDSVIGRDQANSILAEKEDEFVRERKKQEDKYNEYRKNMNDQLKQLKQHNNDLELDKKLVDSESEKELS